MESNVWIVRSFKKLKPIAEIPETPEFITRFLPSPSNSLPQSSSSESGISGPEPTGSSSSSSPSSSHWSNNIELTEDDPSNNHLVSGSEYDVHLSEDGLMHWVWYKQADEADNSSDEDDAAQNFDVALFSYDDNGQDDHNSYNSD